MSYIEIVPSNGWYSRESELGKKATIVPVTAFGVSRDGSQQALIEASPGKLVPVKGNLVCYADLSREEQESLKPNDFMTDILRKKGF
ncbi:hypothetical protein MM182_06380 [Aeromonas sp. MR19]|uniref:hypothetical protein n=1 Tax=Aeromonas sp. MR19 TaxID=2923421 RepID=UPI001F4AFE24|nr:hypothetical protein [Aeromonas sp. MR19]MCH7375008.1 hypothetical protein [Aeromonas sp. MR19]